MRPPYSGLAASGWVCSSCRSSVTLRRLPAALLTRRYASQPRQGKLPDGPLRTRFAPSPTGNLHLGSIRTALFNYLLARRTKGQFLLRIEDTDQKRTVPGAEEKLCNDLQWAGLQWDEGPLVGGPFGPYRQSERTAIYREQIEPLLKFKHAYRCFCSAERLDALNKSRYAKGQALGYDRRCADLSKEESDERAHKRHGHVVRFKMPERHTGYTDLVYGKTGKDKPRQLQTDDVAFEDPILVKSDGFPTYHFANVVDDHLMKITHVIRGSEWMTSTPLHIALYNAFGWTAPAFGHVPLLVDGRGQKLSKRDFKSDLSNYRDALGVYPDALVNFAALLGWSHQLGNDVMNLAELEMVFDLKITKGNTVVSLGKLHYLQKQHAKRYIREGGEMFERMVQDTVSAVQVYVAGQAETSLEAPSGENSGPRDIDERVESHRQRIQPFLRGRPLDSVVRLMLQSEFGPYERPKEFVKSFEGILSSKGHRDAYPTDGEYALEALCIAAGALCFTPAEYWTADVHRANIAALEPPPLGTVHDPKEQAKIWRTALNQFMRLALLDGQPGPSIPHTMAILGRDVCTERLQAAERIVREQTTFTTKPDVKMQSAIKDMDNKVAQTVQGESQPPEKAFKAHKLVPAT